MAKSNIKRIQVALNANGSKLTVDGDCGDKTEQEIYKLIPNASTSTEPHTAHFKLSEFKCHDSTPVPTKYYDNVYKLMLKLEELREELGGKSIRITSGYRTPTHNASVDGASNSQHLYAKAADIKVSGATPDYVYSVAVKVFSDGGVGKYNSFTHVDVRDGKSRWNG